MVCRADSSTLMTMRALKPMTFALQITRDCFMLQRTVWCADPSHLTIDHCPRDSLLLLAGPMTPSFLSFAPSSSCRCWFLYVLLMLMSPNPPPPFDCGVRVYRHLPSLSFIPLVDLDAYVGVILILVLVSLTTFSAFFNNALPSLLLLQWHTSTLPLPLQSHQDVDVGVNVDVH